MSHGSLFAHHWYVGVDEPVDAAKLRELIDSHLKVLNDDYAVERTSALKEVIVDVLPSSVFYDYLQKRVKKVGAATKFPRVIKNKDLQGWLDCIAESKK